MYKVVATISCNGGMVQIPTFFLDENIQGILSEKEAYVVARRILNPLSNPEIKMNIDIVKV